MSQTNPTSKDYLLVHAARLREIASCPLCLQSTDRPALLAGAAALEAVLIVCEKLREIEEDGDQHSDYEDGPEGIANRPNLGMRVMTLARAALTKLEAVHD